MVFLRHPDAQRYDEARRLIRLARAMFPDPSEVLVQDYLDHAVGVIDELDEKAAAKANVREDCR